MITLVGVGHVFDIGAKLDNIILTKNPDIVCVELDRARYEALLADGGRRPTLSLPYAMLAHIQQKLAKKYGVKVGSEMLAAIGAAQKLKKDIALIDMHSGIVLSNIWRSMRWLEKLKLIFGILCGLFVKKEHVESELDRFEQDYDQYMDIFGSQFPTVKKILIDDRDGHMAVKLRELSERYANIVAIVGDGHIEGMHRLLDDLGPEVIRLSELRAADENGSEPAGVTMSYEIEW